MCSEHIKYNINQNKTDLHTFFIRFWAFLVIFLGNSIASIPLRIMLYVFMGSLPENGGLWVGGGGGWGDGGGVGGGDGGCSDRCICSNRVMLL